MTPPKSRDTYYREAETWNRDREDASRASRRIAWIVASVAALVALAEACALVALTPLKTVVPYTLLVDRQTGYVQALDPLNPKRIGADTALTQSFVVQYVIARESFDIAAAQGNYAKVAAWSEGRVRSNYIAAVQSSNPASPIATLPRATVIETRVKSVSVTGQGTLLVRFDTQRRDEGGQVRASQPWVAVVRYRYDGEPMKFEDRLLNPLGFRVTHYQRSAEALVPDAAPVVAPATVIDRTVTTQTTGQTTGQTGGQTGGQTLAPTTTTTATTTVYPARPSPLRAVRRPDTPVRLPTPPTYTGPPRLNADGTPR